MSILVSCHAKTELLNKSCWKNELKNLMSLKINQYCEY